MRTAWHLFLIFILIAGLTYQAQAQIRSLLDIDHELRVDFPKVASITARELETLLYQNNKPIILDIREADEFAVSHVQGAIRISPDASLEDILKATGPDLKNRTIIVYCSVGMRSTQLASRLYEGLKAQGADRIANLSGGIFGWHNDKRHLVQNTQTTSYVHPYNSRWGRLVKQQDLTAYAPLVSGRKLKKNFRLNEPTFRLGAFLGVFTLLALAESLRPHRLRLFPRRQRWLAHFGMLSLATALVRLIALFFPLIGATTAAVYMAQEGWGLFHWLNLPIWIEIIFAVLLLDFAVWTQHVATHYVSILWRFHLVHHADRDLDASSALRFHPIEILLSALYKFVLIFILGPAVVAVIIFEVLLNASAMFSHANLALPAQLDRVLRRVIVTPDMHRIHHSVLRAERDCNFGFCLSIWDHIFGTHKMMPNGGQDGMTIGLPNWQENERCTKLTWLLGQPFHR
jgi:sterol desaturase/sphingolipid hydroxylase (fatty acid hydroxylase superfamily)/rhodanese-related sulfurtransferase